MTAPTRVAVVGAGYFGQFHYDAWSRLDDADLVALCETDSQRAAETAKHFDVPAVFDDVAGMLAEVRPDLVDITAPPKAHMELIRAIAPHCPLIICQKPFCLDIAEAEAAIALAASHGARIAVHENGRFQPWYRAAKALIEGGGLGQIYRATFRLRPGDGQGPNAYLDRQPYFQQMPRFMVHETAIHWIDTFRYLLGEPQGVFARLQKLNPVIAGEDAGTILMDFAGGATALFDGNRLSDHQADNRRLTLGELLLEGSEAVLRLDGYGRLWLRPQGSNEETLHPFDWTDRQFGGDCVYLTNRAILTAWRQDRPAETEASDYIRNLRIEQAVYQSDEEARWIDL